jgi:hypothetical protein
VFGLGGGGGKEIVFGLGGGGGRGRAINVKSIPKPMVSKIFMTQLNY